MSADHGIEAEYMAFMRESALADEQKVVSRLMRHLRFVDQVSKNDSPALI